jgi:hypothetical protein
MIGRRLLLGFYCGLPNHTRWTADGSVANMTSERMIVQSVGERSTFKVNYHDIGGRSRSFSLKVDTPLKFVSLKANFIAGGDDILQVKLPFFSLHTAIFLKTIPDSN